MADTSACVSCGRHPAYSFRVLEVQTLPLREMDGERKIQALGAIRRAAVCEDCARRRLEGTMDIAGTAGKGLLLYAGILLAGIVSAVLFLRRFPPAGLTGCAAVICGILGIYQTLGNALRHKKEAESLPEEEALRDAAWEVFLMSAPRKSMDSDLSYIPITPETLSMKKGNLMAAYDLLPELAVKAYDLIHQDQTE